MKNEKGPRLIRGTNIYQLSIGNKIFYSGSQDYFSISMDFLKGSHVKDLPVNVKISLSDPPLNFSTLTISEDIPEFSIYRENENSCRVICDLQINPIFWEYNLDITTFLTLKRELLLNSKRMSSQIEEEDIINQYLSYSIIVSGDTVEKLLADAFSFNKEISREITKIVNRLPALLLEAMGITNYSSSIAQLPNRV
jgi:hypothetical protein